MFKNNFFNYDISLIDHGKFFKSLNVKQNVCYLTNGSQKMANLCFDQR